MKRKALITSTALLLVALMCLATASYAWFTATGATEITGLQVEVKGADAAIQLSENKENWRASLTKQQLIDDGQKVPNILTAVSTVDGKNFFATTYTAAGEWDANVTSDGYILIDFYAKAPSAGTASFNLDFVANTKQDGTSDMKDGQLDLFKSAVKVAFAEGDNALTTYDLAVDSTDGYKPMKSDAAVAQKVFDEDKNNYYFEPTTGTDTAANYGDARTQSAWAATRTVSFAKNEVKHFTVAIWLEGMDKDCVGSFDMKYIDVVMDFTGWQAQTAA
ncbi:MAG: hypothetical protein IKU52_04910 [Clostridia bacterium]|nr:hypothetical protein [Clostridia bacterium]